MFKRIIAIITGCLVLISCSLAIHADDDPVEPPPKAYYPLTAYYEKVGDADISYPLLVIGAVTSNYGSTDDVHPNPHQGIDLMGNEGDPVIAVVDGTITYTNYWDGTTEGMNSYGNCVDVTGEDGTVYRFAHLSAINVSWGQEVIMGQQIGRVGNTGRSFGAHLHFEVLINDIKQDPTPYVFPKRLSVRIPDGMSVIISGEIPSYNEETEEEELLPFQYTYFKNTRGGVEVYDINNEHTATISRYLLNNGYLQVTQVNWDEAQNIHFSTYEEPGISIRAVKVDDAEIDMPLEEYILHTHIGTNVISFYTNNDQWHEDESDVQEETATPPEYFIPDFAEKGYVYIPKEEPLPEPINVERPHVQSLDRPVIQSEVYGYYAITRNRSENALAILTIISVIYLIFSEWFPGKRKTQP